LTSHAERLARDAVARARTALAIAWRDYRILRSYRLTMTFDLLLGIVSILIYYYISRAIRPNPSADFAGADSYFAFAAVGICLALVIQGATAGLVVRIREEQLTGTLEMMFAQPVTAVDAAFGLAGFPFAFAMVRVVLYLAVASLLLGLNLDEASALGFVIMMASISLMVVALGIALGALVLVSKRGDRIALLGTLALTLGGGAYFPTDVLPSAVQPLVDAAPTKFALDGLREALFQGHGWGGDAAILAAIGAVGIPLALWAFSGALRFVRRRGTIALY
jgi:ABC-2 type transport system permease protein